MITCLHWQSSVLPGQAGDLRLCRDPGRSHPACTLPSDCTAPQASTEPTEKGGDGKGSSLMRGIQKCESSRKEQSATSSPSWQAPRGLSRQKPALSSASTELTAALAVALLPIVKESQALASSHFTCGPWQVPAGCTVRRPARQGARRKKRQDELQLCLSSPGREGTGEAGPALPLTSFWQAFPSLTQGVTTPESKRQGAAELAPSSGSLSQCGCECPSREQSPARLNASWHRVSPSSCAVMATLVPPRSPTPRRGAEAHACAHTHLVELLIGNQVLPVRS